MLGHLTVYRQARNAYHRLLQRDRYELRRGAREFYARFAGPRELGLILRVIRDGIGFLCDCGRHVRMHCGAHGRHRVGQEVLVLAEPQD